MSVKKKNYKTKKKKRDLNDKKMKENFFFFKLIN